jgi:hypothetical protein
MNENRWRKSTYSSPNGGNCVEVADRDHHVMARDTTTLEHGFRLPAATRRREPAEQAHA